VEQEVQAADQGVVEIVRMEEVVVAVQVVQMGPDTQEHQTLAVAVELAVGAVVDSTVVLVVRVLLL
jgi:hypothetical protein